MMWNIHEVLGISILTLTLIMHVALFILRRIRVRTDLIEVITYGQWIPFRCALWHLA